MLAAQSKEVSIGGRRYSIRPLSASVAMRVMVRVLKGAAPAFADLTSLRDASRAVGSLLSGLLVDIDEATVEYVQAELAKVTDVVGANGNSAKLSDIYDVYFTGRIVEQLEWTKAAAEVTYGPLLARLSAPTAPEPQSEG